MKSFDVADQHLIFYCTGAQNEDDELTKEIKSRIAKWEKLKEEAKNRKKECPSKDLKASKIVEFLGSFDMGAGKAGKISTRSQLSDTFYESVQTSKAFPIPFSFFLI